MLPDAGMIDRPNRDRLLSAINRYLDEAITAFAFDEEIFQIASKDAVVKWVSRALWYHYDKCKDHLVVLSKEEWNHIQRLVLVLQSDAHIERRIERKWSLRQLVAGIAAGGFGLCAAWLGIGWRLFGVALLFAPISMWLDRWCDPSIADYGEKQRGRYPFSSFAELRAVRKAVVGFSKRKHPPHAGTRTIRDPSPRKDMGKSVFEHTLWAFLSPAVLLYQALPDKQTFTRICPPVTS